MTNKKIIRRNNKPLNIYLAGGILNAGANMLSGVMNPKGNTTKAGSIMQGIGSAASAIPGIGGVIGAGVNVVGGLVNTMFGSKIDEEAVEKMSGANTKQYNTIADVSSGESLMDQYGSYNPLDDIQKKDVGSEGWFSKKATNKTRELNALRDNANQRAEESLMRGFNIIDSNTDQEALANFSAYGGNLFTSIPNVGQHGGNFSNGVTIVDNGGTHEQNSNNGVPMGVDQNGTPNLVEEGEVKFNDYVYSNRLSANAKLMESYKLPTKFAKNTFASIAEKISKESSERPNDSISKRGLISGMTRLMQAQEEIRSIKPTASSGKKFALGGSVKNFLAGLPTQEDEVPDNYSSNPQLGNMIAANDYRISQGETPGLSSSKGNGIGLESLRYAPAIGSGVASITDALGITNKPDYSDADLIGGAIDNINTPMVEPSSISNYLTYNPLDRDYYTNKLNAQSGATRRAIGNQSGGNRATVTAGLLAADYNYGQSLGSLARQSEEYNQSQRERVEGFNRGTNQFNAESKLKASMSNQQARQQSTEIRLKGRMAQADMRTRERDKTGAAKSANLTNFFDSLGDIGREEFSRNMIKSNPALGYTIDSQGNISYKNKKRNGGYLTYGR